MRVYNGDVWRDLYTRIARKVIESKKPFNVNTILRSKMYKYKYSTKNVGTISHPI